MNPELEKPERTKPCQECGGEGWIKSLFFGWYRCDNCRSTGAVPVDETDAREDAEEARWEARNDR